MPFSVKRIEYFNLTVQDKPGEAYKMLSAFSGLGVNLLAFTGFPIGGGKAQLDFVSDDMAGVRRVARKEGLRLSKTKKGFLVQGSDELGACHRQLKKLADKRINVTAVDALAAGRKRYGMILWVKPKDYARASRALGAK